MSLQKLKIIINNIDKLINNIKFKINKLKSVNTMNLSKNSKDKEPLSGIKSSKENISNKNKKIIELEKEIEELKIMKKTSQVNTNQSQPKRPPNPFASALMGQIQGLNKSKLKKTELSNTNQNKKQKEEILKKLSRLGAKSSGITGLENAIRQRQNKTGINVETQIKKTIKIPNEGKIKISRSRKELNSMKKNLTELSSSLPNSHKNQIIIKERIQNINSRIKKLTNEDKFLPNN
jgi:chromosome segregation ATPase